MNASFDMQGRVTLTGLTNANVQKKVAGSSDSTYVTMTTSAGSSFVDLRPWWNWKFVPYSDSDSELEISITALAVALYGADNGDVPAVAVDSVTIPSSTSIGVIQGMSSMAIRYGDMLWGKNWGTVGNHTINLSYPGSIGDYFIGYAYSDFYTPSGTAITYKCGTETTTVTPTVDRQAVIAAWTDRYVALLTSALPSTSAGTARWLQTALGYYYLTADSRVMSFITNNLYPAMLARMNGNYMLNDGYNSKSGLEQGVAMSCFWGLYKFTGDSSYLTKLDTAVTWVRDHWARATITTAGHTYTDALGPVYDTTPTSADLPTRNLGRQLIGACALAYNEPASALYHNATLKTLLQNNMDAVLGLGTRSRIGPNGELGYFSGLEYEPGYATYELGWWKLLSDICDGHQATEYAGALAWLNGLFPATDPFLQFSFEHPQSNPWGVMLHNFLGGNTISESYKDMLFSAACNEPYIDQDDWGNYSATGYAAGATVPTAYMDDFMLILLYAMIPVGITKDWLLSATATPTKHIQTRGGKIQQRGGHIIER